MYGAPAVTPNSDEHFRWLVATLAPYTPPANPRSFRSIGVVTTVPCYNQPRSTLHRYTVHAALRGDTWKDMLKYEYFYVTIFSHLDGRTIKSMPYLIFSNVQFLSEKRPPPPPKISPKNQVYRENLSYTDSLKLLKSD